MLVYDDDVALQHLPKLRHSRNIDRDIDGAVTEKLCISKNLKKNYNS